MHKDSYSHRLVPFLVRPQLDEEAQHACSGSFGSEIDSEGVLRVQDQCDVEYRAMTAIPLYIEQWQ